jgi:hypothetical protein
MGMETAAAIVQESEVHNRMAMKAPSGHSTRRPLTAQNPGFRPLWLVIHKLP